MRERRKRMIEFGSIQPMLAPRDISQPFNDPAWSYEIKWNGIRCVLYFDGTQIRLQNRQGKDITKQFPEIVDNVNLPHPCILDGEIVILVKEVPDFGLIQKRSHLENSLQIKLRSHSHPVTYMVFDLLELNEKNCMAWPLITRRQLLAATVTPQERIKPSSMYPTSDAFGELVEIGHEGMMAKRLDSAYRQSVNDYRAGIWRKIKPNRSGCFYIVGYTQGEGWRSELGALVLAEQVGDQWRYVGKVGSGLTMDTVSLLLEILPRYTTAYPVVSGNGNGGVKWVTPGLQCEVAYMDITPDGKLYQPRFKKLITN
jgi:bifunctional non-homologous end joining protein LigD